MSTADETTPFRRIDLEVLKLYVDTALDRYALTHLAPGCYTDEIVNEVANNLVYGLSVKLATNNVWTETYATEIHPKTWWQAFKERHFPKWLLKRYPVQWKTMWREIRHYHVCPHLLVDDQRDHLSFMVMGKLEKCAAKPGDPYP